MNLVRFGIEDFNHSHRRDFASVDNLLLQLKKVDAHDASVLKKAPK